MRQSRSRGRDQFTGLVAACEDAFSYLVSEYGYRVSHSAATERSFAVDFKGDQVGVRVMYQVGDALSVDVCLLDNSDFPGPVGEIRPDTRVIKFDLLDIEAVAGKDVPSAGTEAFAIPTRELLGEYAVRLRSSASDLLSGAMDIIPALQERVLDRARAAARAKWGARASEYGW